MGWSAVGYWLGDVVTPVERNGVVVGLETEWTETAAVGAYTVVVSATLFVGSAY